MRMTLNSTNLESVDYDVEHETLDVWFHSGSHYRYLDVPDEVFRDLISDDSPGHFFSEEIKGHYITEKL